ncbi:MAG: glycosyl transferase family 2 [Chloroflexota bacterium]|nr:glycosyl transferase family 2 [Chloroflexota bacterium]
MSLETILQEDTQRRIEEIGQADILVGIPSFKNAGTIGHVVRMAAQGMVEYFPDLRPVLVNSDGGSPDGTRQVVLDTPVPEGVEKIVTVYRGPSGKGSSFRTIFEIARALGVRACVVVDSDLRSIAPWWIERLAGPVIKEGYSYVTPFYTRHKYDGTITNNVVYPMTRMLYGVDLRQPIGGDFGFSSKLLEAYLSQDVWQTDVARYGIDIWMTTTAINEGVEICQGRMGAKIHDVKDPAAALGPMFVQVVGTLFSMMTRYEDRWKSVTSNQLAPMYGPEVEQEPDPVAVTLELMIDKLRAGVAERAELWQHILTPQNLEAVREIASLPYADYTFPAELWAQIVFDFAVAYNKSGLDPEKIILGMTPLYYGRTAGLVVQSKEMSSAEFEKQVIQAQARVFEELKPQLMKKWGAGR